MGSEGRLEGKEGGPSLLTLYIGEGIGEGREEENTLFSIQSSRGKKPEKRKKNPQEQRKGLSELYTGVKRGWCIVYKKKKKKGKETGYSRREREKIGIIPVPPDEGRERVA